MNALIDLETETIEAYDPLGETLAESLAEEDTLYGFMARRASAADDEDDEDFDDDDFDDEDFDDDEDDFDDDFDDEDFDDDEDDFDDEDDEY
jgi:hypothetical protein